MLRVRLPIEAEAPRAPTSQYGDQQEKQQDVPSSERPSNDADQRPSTERRVVQFQRRARPRARRRGTSAIDVGDERADDAPAGRRRRVSTPRPSRRSRSRPHGAPGVLHECPHLSTFRYRRHLEDRTLATASSLFEQPGRPRHRPPLAARPLPWRETYAHPRPVRSVATDHCRSGLDRRSRRPPSAAMSAASSRTGAVGDLELLRHLGRGTAAG